MNTLDRFEKFAERLIEGVFDKIFKPNIHPADLARELAQAMEAGQTADSQGRYQVPAQYHIVLNPQDYAHLQTTLSLADEILALERYLLNLVGEMNYRLAGNITVEILDDAAIKRGQIRIMMESVQPDEASVLSDTQRVARLGGPPAAQWVLTWPDAPPVSLGAEHIHLGRAVDNDVILPHPSVSRHHARLSWQAGTYFVQNLSQSQPLIHNGQALDAEASVPLKPGDALQLGQLTLTLGVHQSDL